MEVVFLYCVFSYVFSLGFFVGAFATGSKLVVLTLVVILAPVSMPVIFGMLAGARA